jgi:hypothetical protein
MLGLINTLISGLQLLPELRLLIDSLNDIFPIRKEIFLILGNRSRWLYGSKYERLSFMMLEIKFE